LITGSLDKLLYDTEEQISNEQKIRWIREIAEGMSHLHKYNIVHRDLAARNILLSQPNLADAHLKISVNSFHFSLRLFFILTVLASD
jgi:serine/threonine protein kinase